MPESCPFRIRQGVLDRNSVRLEYSFGDEPPFVERLELPPLDEGAAADPAAVAAALRLVTLLAGTSYYKSRAPAEVRIEFETTRAERRLVEAVYDHGLREFAHRNELPIPVVERFHWTGEPLGEITTGDPPTGIGRPLVPFGGGKDSTVVLSLLPEARPLTVNPTSTHHRVAAALGHELLVVERRLDRLDELTAPSRLNEHVPITAIVSAISVLVAARSDFTAVVMANEAAASEPTLLTTDRSGEPAEVNHQWSKGLDCESMLRAAFSRSGVAVDYFSLLRPLGEQQIMRQLARQSHVLPHLISCNRAFAGRTAGGSDETPQRWCGECPKCLFTFLMLAEQLEPAELAPIFGGDLLDRPSLADDFAALWADQKPFECVGERHDAAGAMVRLSEDTQWQDHPVVRAMTPSARSRLAVPEPRSPRTDTFVPAAFRDRLESVGIELAAPDRVSSTGR